VRQPDATDRTERASLLEYDCAECKDWGTILVTADGKETMEPCPAQCEVARKFQRIQAAQTRHWLRQCNGELPGALVGRDEAEFIAGLPGVVGSLESKLTWFVDDHGGKRKFTLTPMSREQAGDWIVAQQQTRPPKK